MSPTALYGSLIAFGTLAVVAALSYWQWSDRRARGADLSDEDQAHFRHQDVRRSIVAVVMTLLAAGIYFGSRMPYRVNGRPNIVFVELWLGIFALVLILLGLALVDWLATRNYALRHRTEIVREGLEILRDEMRLRSRHTTNGRAGQEFHRSPNDETEHPD